MTAKEALLRLDDQLINPDFFQNVIDQAHDIVIFSDVEGKVIYANQTAEKIYGYTEEEFLNIYFQDLTAAENIGETFEYLSKINNKGLMFCAIHRRANGEAFPVEISAKLHKYDQKSIIVSRMRDISENIAVETALFRSEEKYRKLHKDLFAVHKELTATEEELRKQYETLRASEEKFSKVFNFSPDIMAINRLRDGMYIDVNPSFLKHAECSKDEILTKTSVELGIFSHADRSRLLKELHIKGEVRNLESLLVFRNGRTIHASMSAVVLNIDNEKYLYTVTRDISERKKMEDQLKYLSLHDSLTQLHNRAYFEEKLTQLQKSGFDSIGLLMCDVDGLKIINDTLGHGIGDIILQTVANILRNTFRADDLVARIGGDEFVILRQTNSLPELAASSKRIENQIKIHNKNNPTLPISLSIGYAVNTHSPLNINILYRDADYNMYREKLHRQKSAHNSIVLAMMKALEARDFLTEGHGERMQEMIQAFAHKIGLPENSIADLKLFAQFHDIGKVGIPDSILFKPTKLSFEEWSIMQQHCEIGYRIAKSAPDLAPIADWILKHQEHWNGKGYPNGIAGENIPLECRMLAIVDAYDAMTSDRPYRKAMSKELAIVELKRCSGIQFDPNLINPFISLLM